MSETQSPHGPVNPDVRHEPSDASLAWVGAFAASLAALGIVIAVGLWGMFHYLLQRPLPVEPPVSVLAESQRGRLPPQPRLEGLVRVGEAGEPQPTPGSAGAGYAWVDRQAGIVRIPPPQAMKILAGKMPSQPSPAGSRAFPRGPELPSSSNSGRTVPDQRGQSHFRGEDPVVDPRPSFRRENWDSPP